LRFKLQNKPSKGAQFIGANKGAMSVPLDAGISIPSAAKVTHYASSSFFNRILEASDAVNTGDCKRKLECARPFAEER
jgi:hypothetical protein